MHQILRRFSILLGLCGLFWWLLVLLIPQPERLFQPSSTAVYYRDGKVAHAFLAPDDRWRLAVELNDIDPNYIKAIVEIEDKRFWWHFGFDPLAILRAATQNILNGEVVSGASTLTMQLVRILEPRERTLTSKLIEAFRASQLEYFYTKSEILSYYLTFVPYGKNIEGVEAASLLYFGHRANHLDSREIATLIAVPQNPNQRYPRVENHERLKWSRDHIAHLLHKKKILPISEAQDFEPVFSATPPSRLWPFPKEVPHISVQLNQQSKGHERILTTIDSDLQRQIEQLVGRHKSRLNQSDIHHIAVLVVDNQSSEIRAIMGGFDFFDSHTGAQIPAFSVPRNCGSTLKPFLYAYALDQGLVLPSTLIRDIPEQFGGYTPRNFMGNYDGLVPLEDSLVRSLNAPFIRLLADVGFGRFASLILKGGGTRFEKRIHDYGLSMMLGAELSPWELAQLYAMMGQNGQYRPIHVLMDTVTPKVQRLLSQASVWMTAQTLQRRDRPDFPARSAFATTRSIAWKTGTSVGFRDAWSAGWYGDYTVVVWVGNLDYRSSQGLIGAEAAAPIFFDVVEALPIQPKAPKPTDVIEVEVCAFSGHIPKSSCEKKTTLGIQDRIPTRICPYHHDFEVDLLHNERVFPGCREGKETELRRFLMLPSSVQAWFPGQIEHPPSISETCRGRYVPEVEPGSLKILSPYAGQISMLLRGVPKERQPIAMMADYPDPNAKLSWFVNDEWVATQKAGETVFWPPIVGRHVLRVNDSHGHTASRAIEVMLP